MFLPPTHICSPSLHRSQEATGIFILIVCWKRTKAWSRQATYLKLEFESSWFWLLNWCSKAEILQCQWQSSHPGSWECVWSPLQKVLRLGDWQVGMLRACVSTIPRQFCARRYWWILPDTLPRDLHRLCHKAIHIPVTLEGQRTWLFPTMCL